MKNSLLKFLLLFCLLSPVCFLQSQEIGIQLYSLRNQFKSEVEGTLKQIQDWGLSAIEGGGTYGMTPEAYKALLGKYDLKMRSYGASFEGLRDNPEKVAAEAKFFGADFVMCAWIPHKGDDFTLEDTDNAIEVFNSAGKVLAAHGLTLAYHPHGYEFRPYQKGTLFDRMAQGAADFVFQMDVYWVQHGGEDPLKLLNRYPDLFKMMHLKDMEPGTPKDYTGHSDVETNVVLGTGEVDIKGLVLRARELGMPYLFLEDESSAVVQQVPESLKFLETVLKED